VVAVVAIAGTLACAAKEPTSSDAGPVGSGFFVTPPQTICDAAADAEFALRNEADARPRNCTVSKEVSFTADVQPILESKCSGEVCHDYSWAAPDGYSAMVRKRAPECCDGRSIVSPGNPQDSYLVQKLRGVSICSGVVMPAAGTISATEIGTIEAWVCEGAPNN